MQIRHNNPNFDVVTIDKNRIAVTPAGETCEVDRDCIIMFQSRGFTPAKSDIFEITLNAGDDDD